MKKFSKKLAELKILIDRSRMYLVMIQFLMITYMFFDDMDNMIGEYLTSHSWLIIVIIIILLLLPGYIDKILYIREKELEIYSLDDPVRNEILENTRKILKLKE